MRCCCPSLAPQLMVTCPTGASPRLSTLPVLSEHLSLTSEDVTIWATVCALPHCSARLPLCRGPLAPFTAGLALPQARNSGCLLTSICVAPSDFFHQRPSGSPFTLCLCLLTEEQSCPAGEGAAVWAVQMGAGHSRQKGAHIPPGPCPDQAAHPGVHTPPRSRRRERFSLHTGPGLPIQLGAALVRPPPQRGAFPLVLAEAPHKLMVLPYPGPARF